jgi:hypothetical protein
MKIKTLKNDKIKSFLDIAEKINNNPRFDRKQFENFKIDKNGPKFLVLENNNEYLALCVLQEFPEGIMYLNEIQSLRKGFGKKLIQLLLNRYQNIWWTAEYLSGEKLLNYYRQFDVKEYNIGPTKWSNGKDHYIFYKVDDKNESIILNIANSWKQGKKKIV